MLISKNIFIYAVS